VDSLVKQARIRFLLEVSTMDDIKVGLLGTGFVTNVHMEAIQYVKGAQVFAVYSRTEKHAREFARYHQIPHYFTDYSELLAMDEIDIVLIGLPNFLHAEAAIAAAAAGKHVIVEKPMCLTLEEADSMIEACRSNNVQLMYAEQLCFAPKYNRIYQLARDGALGSIYQLRQSEKHFGPHSEWFWDIDKSGGGVLMDMGCHALGWFRWMLGTDRVPQSIYASMDTVVHHERTRGEDNSIVIVNYANGVKCIAEDSWAKRGGMDDRIEVYGSEGVSYADLFMGNAATTYSEQGYDYAMEKSEGTRGWSFTVYEEVFNQGYPHELAHFVDCVRNDKQPLQTGEDGKAVLEMIYAAYYSAHTGKEVELPFAARVDKPVDLWLKGLG